MNTLQVIENAMNDTLGARGGAFVLVDGQYGSTGKGLAASVLAEAAGRMFQAVTSNAGPNSGHTSYFGDIKVVLQQLPTFGVINCLQGRHIPMYMNAGAILDLNRLEEEILDYIPDDDLVRIHPAAAVVTSEAKEVESALVGAIGSTGKGTGGALARKVLRDPNAVAQNHPRPFMNFGMMPRYREARVFVEVSQGFSLSLNAGGFYPYCTSRDCTVTQALSDARLHPDDLLGSMMVLRTFPIRVAGNSGGCYPDQSEITWADLGVEPEITTVTKKVRRVFTWSDMQFMDAVNVNRPTMLFFNFMNYLPESKWFPWMAEKVGLYRSIMNKNPELVLYGTGPLNGDVKVFHV
jgi:adenylosuccinate synthase